MLYLLQGLHVLLGIFWFGGAMFSDMVVMPAVRTLDPAGRQAFLAPYARQARRVIAPLSGLTIVFGLALGFPLGAWSRLGSLYGETFLAGLVLAVGLSFWGAMVVGRGAERLGALAPDSPDLDVAFERFRAGAVAELAGFVVLFVLMVALRFGY